ncbi:hypothetical protein Tco_1048484 [Tanacetum coccineum]
MARMRITIFHGIFQKKLHCAKLGSVHPKIVVKFESLKFLQLLLFKSLEDWEVSLLQFMQRFQKFENPTKGEDVLTGRIKKLYEDITAGFCNLEDETRASRKEEERK